jgi:hypothetical protein
MKHSLNACHLIEHAPYQVVEETVVPGNLASSKYITILPSRLVVFHLQSGEHFAIAEEWMPWENAPT